MMEVIERRKGWVLLRRDGRLTETPIHALGEHWQPCRPNGTPRYTQVAP